MVFRQNGKALDGVSQMISQEDIDAFKLYNLEDLTLESYQNDAAKTAIYDEAYSIVYPALGLVGEAGEVANKVKKMLRDDTLDRDGLKGEIGDCLWYLAALCRDLNLDLADVAQSNLDKLNSRMKRGTIQGSGDNR